MRSPSPRRGLPEVDLLGLDLTPAQRKGWVVRGDLTTLRFLFESTENPGGSHWASLLVLERNFDEALAVLVVGLGMRLTQNQPCSSGLGRLE
jgi:hypothetical protein